MARANLYPPPRTLRLKLLPKSRDAFTPDSSDQRRADKFVGKHIRFGTEPFLDWPTVTAFLRNAA